MTNILNIFNQFLPSSIGWVPLAGVGGGLAIFWIMGVHSTHFVFTRWAQIPVMFGSVFTLLFSAVGSLPRLWGFFFKAILFLFLSFNLLSLVPYSFSQTAHFSFTFSVSMSLWLSLQILGLMQNWENKVSHLVPTGTPIYLIPVLIIIESISLCIQPLTLGFRLGANLLAGHLLIFLCSCAVWEAVSVSSLGIVGFLLLIALLVLEIAVSCIQAVVFVMLAKQYLEENINS
uniref:ATP synthase subunit a n=1 Tax=Histampica haimaensis TaxID=2839059 RepID=A0A8K1K7B4_9ECHI|nr:ATP synthase F0 subunit 6 [Histampica sp. h LQ-2021]